MIKYFSINTIIKYTLYDFMCLIMLAHVAFVFNKSTKWLFSFRL
jgi:hypothetical protein